MRIGLPILPIILLGSGLAGCVSDSRPMPKTEMAPPPGMLRILYSCDSGASVTAVYDNSDPAVPRARLTIRDRSFDLYNVIAASGARYATEQGFEPDKGLQWWTKGNEATLSEMTLDHTAAEPRLIDTCRAVEEPDGPKGSRL